MSLKKYKAQIDQGQLTSGLSPPHLLRVPKDSL